ncbi:hypothetical protein QBC47DRAFT_358163 [Echria macrotheca]|uniref:Uncharacterized protein n=1 Tax=Echria macrotheca TaxID=438768 RepID=A0AAJ0FCF6_9PEZI|nr:hypothetical protein QBC47DRAFT_358163 [Echria macrotheca]
MGSRKNARRIPYGRYTYLLGMPASEQPPVLKVATKFGRIPPKDVTIKRHELEGLASIYVRIYQVPHKTRDRLERWRRHHQRLAASWGMSFWNTRAKDAELGIVPREAGIPPAALNMVSRIAGSGVGRVRSPKSQDDVHRGVAGGGRHKNSKGENRKFVALGAALRTRYTFLPKETKLAVGNEANDSDSTVDFEEEKEQVGMQGSPAVDSGNGDREENNTEGNGEDDPMVPPPSAQSPQNKSRQTSVSVEDEDEEEIEPDHKTDKNNDAPTSLSADQHRHDELEAARDALKDLFIWFQSTSITLDEADPLKEPLTKMSWSAARSFERASRAGRKSASDLNGNRELSEEERAARISARRAMVDEWAF